MVGRVRRDADLARGLAQAEGTGPARFDEPYRRGHEGVAEISVVVGVTRLRRGFMLTS